jgi:hypothetical protein
MIAVQEEEHVVAVEISLALMGWVAEEKGLRIWALEEEPAGLVFGLPVGGLLPHFLIKGFVYYFPCLVLKPFPNRF